MSSTLLPSHTHTHTYTHRGKSSAPAEASERASLFPAATNQPSSASADNERCAQTNKEKLQSKQGGHCQAARRLPIALPTLPQSPTEPAEDTEGARWGKNKTAVGPISLSLSLFPVLTFLSPSLYLSLSATLCESFQQRPAALSGVTTAHLLGMKCLGLLGFVSMTNMLSHTMCIRRQYY